MTGTVAAPGYEAASARWSAGTPMLTVRFSDVALSDVYVTMTAGTGAPRRWCRWLPGRGEAKLLTNQSAVVLRPDAARAAPADLRVTTSGRALSLLSTQGVYLSAAQLTGLLAGRPRVRCLDLNGISVAELEQWLAGGKHPHVPGLRHVRLSDGVEGDLRARVCRALGRQVVPDLVGTELVDPSTSGDHHRVRVLLDHAVEHYPGAFRPGESLGHATGRAAILVDAGRSWEALSAISVLRTEPDVNSLLVATRIMIQLGELPAALATTELAIAEGSLGDGHAARADVLRRMGLTSQALYAATEALRSDPTHYWALASLCLLELNLGQRRNAARELAALEREHPDSDNVHICRRAIAEQDNKRGAALAASRSLVASDPEDAERLAALAAGERRARPWSSRWAATALAAVRSNPKHGAQLRKMAVSHPRSWAVLAGIVGWFATMIAIGTQDSPVPLGMPLTASALAALGAYGFMRSRLPRVVRADTASRRSRVVWLALVAYLVLAVGLWVWGSPLTNEKKAPKAPHVPQVPHVPQIPSFSPYPFPTYSVPGMPTIGPLPTLTPR